MLQILIYACQKDEDGYRDLIVGGHVQKLNPKKQKTLEITCGMHHFKKLDKYLSIMKWFSNFDFCFWSSGGGLLLKNKNTLKKKEKEYKTQL